MVLLDVILGAWEVVVLAIFLIGLYLWTYNENCNLILTGNKDGRKAFERESNMTEADYTELMLKTIDQEILPKVEKTPLGMLRRSSV